MRDVPNAPAANTRMLFLVIVLAAGLLAPAAAQARSSARLDSTERRVIKRINAVRAAHGLPAVIAQHSLNRAADRHSWEILAKDWFAHSSPNGTTAGQRVRRYRRARAVGEVLAYVPRANRRNSAKVVGLWMSSPGHRQVLLSRTFRRVGVARQMGRLGSKRVAVFTADFASRR